MATALGPEKLSSCSICYGQLINPHRLPGCFHLFCENCLLIYITNIKSNDKDSCEFQCPNCRRQIPIPKSTEDLQSWVKSLEGLITGDTMASNTSSEETVNDSLCISCKDIETSVPAEKYCVDCEENLCERCSRIRHRAKVLNGHSIFDLQQAKEGVKNDGQQELINAMTKFLKCSSHPDKSISHICRDDNALGCTDCIISNHRHCDTIIDLQDEDIKANTDTKVKQIKDKMNKMTSRVNDLTNFKKANVMDVKRKSEEITDKIRETRMKLNTVLDALEENISSKTKSFVKNVSIEAEDEMAKYSDINITLEEHASLINFTEKIGSSSQIFIVLEKLMLDMESIEKKILKCADECNSYDVELKIESVLDNLVILDANNTNQAASIAESVKKLPISGFKIKQWQFEGSLEKIAEYPILPEESYCAYPQYYCIVYRRNLNSLFLISYECHYFCCSADEKYKPVTCLNNEVVGGRPFCATNLKHGELAVSIPENKTICILSVQMKVSGNINTTYKPRALYGLRNGDIAVSWINPVAFGILHFTGFYTARPEDSVYFQHDTAGRKLKTFDFMTVDETRSHVIQPCTDDKAVYCFDFEGKPIFKYSHEDLVSPRGTSISGDGNIFVCDEERSVIHVISPDGHGLHVIREGCPNKPLSIAFDKSGLQFAVSQRCKPWKLIRLFRLA